MSHRQTRSVSAAQSTRLSAVVTSFGSVLIGGVRMPRFNFTEARQQVLAISGGGWEPDVWVVGDPDNGAYEWVLVKDGQAERHSDFGYGQSSIALRDGLIAVHGLPDRTHAALAKAGL